MKSVRFGWMNGQIRPISREYTDRPPAPQHMRIAPNRHWRGHRRSANRLNEGWKMAKSLRRPLVAGNWKMNGLKASAAELGKIAQGAGVLAGKADLMICPPATLIMKFVADVVGSPVEIGGQDCHAEPSGAFTGDISAEMLADR